MPNSIEGFVAESVMGLTLPQGGWPAQCEPHSKDTIVAMINEIGEVLTALWWPLTAGLAFFVYLSFKRKRMAANASANMAISQDVPGQSTRGARPSTEGAAGIAYYWRPG